MDKRTPGDLSRIHVVRGRRFLLKVEDSEDAAEYRKYESLRNEIWGFPEDSLPGTRNMLCENFLHEGSSLFLAVYAADDNDELAPDPKACVGFSYGFVGLKDKALGFSSPDNLWFYSQYTALIRAYRSYGLGVLIKEFQRDVLLEVLGISTVVCTYDPLTWVNARRNIHQFGMDVLEYRPAVYGDFGGLLNRLDVPSDRFFMSWDLRKKPEPPELSLETLKPLTARLFKVEIQDVQGRSGRLKLDVIRKATFSARGELLLVPIPDDFYLMLHETDVEAAAVRRIPLDWRLATRKIFQTLLAEGYRIIDFLRVDNGSYYLLANPAVHLEKR